MTLPSALMGKRELAPRVSGKIRPGIMVLTKKGRENDRALALYDQGVAAGRSFEEINEEVAKQCGTGLLRPVNTQYFTVRRQDFAIPEIAELIMQRFGEVREDGQKHLYRFPAVFGSDEVTRILDFRFQMFTASGLKYWSGESEDGQQRLCRTFAPLRKDEKTQRVVRMTGGRLVLSRQENAGACAPERCNEFQTGQCRMRGRILFYIPGIPGAGLFEIPTGSKNFGFDSEARLLEILRLGGTLPTLVDGKPVFWITKRLRRNIPMIDYEKGTTARTDQWLIEIEADLDMSRLRARNQRLVLVQADGAAAALLGQPSVPQLAPSAEVDSGATASVKDPKAAAPAQPQQAPAEPTAKQASATEPKSDVKTLRREANELLQGLGVEPQSYASWAIAKWGNTWSRTAATLKEAIAELRGLEPKLQSVTTHVTALGIEQAVFHAYASLAFGAHWQFSPELLAGIEEELTNAFRDRANYVAAVKALVETETIV